MCPSSRKLGILGQGVPCFSSLFISVPCPFSCACSAHICSKRQQLVYFFLLPGRFSFVMVPQTSSAPFWVVCFAATNSELSDPCNLCKSPLTVSSLGSCPIYAAWKDTEENRASGFPSAWPECITSLTFQGFPLALGLPAQSPKWECGQAICLSFSQC